MPRSAPQRALASVSRGSSEPDPNGLTAEWSAVRTATRVLFPKTSWRQIRIVESQGAETSDF